MIKQRSICFPDETTKDFNVSRILSPGELQITKNNFLETISLSKAFCNYVLKKQCTNELGEQLAARKSAFDAEINEAEEQARIFFEEAKKRLECEYEEKFKELELELKKEQLRIGKRQLEDEAVYEAYVKASSVYDKLFDLYLTLSAEVNKEIKEAQDNGMIHNKCYMKLCESNRLLIVQVEKILEAKNKISEEDKNG